MSPDVDTILSTILVVGSMAWLIYAVRREWRRGR